MVGIINEMAKMNEKIDSVDKDLSNVKEQLNTQSHQMNEEIKKIWSEINSVKTNLTESNVNEESLSKQVQELTAALINDGPWTEVVKKEVDTGLKTVREDVEEKMEIERRKNNIMIFGVAEMDAGEDSEAIERLFTTLKLDYTRHVESQVRVGKFSPDKPRPLKLKIKTFEGKKEVLVRAKMLRDLDSYKGVFLAPDLTRKQQAVDRDLRTNLKRIRDEGEEHSFIKSGKIV